VLISCSDVSEEDARILKSSYFAALTKRSKDGIPHPALLENSQFGPTSQDHNMRVLFVTASAYLPQSRGGMQSSANELCGALQRRGHRVAVLAGLKTGGLVGWKARLKMMNNQWRSGSKVFRDSVSEHPVWRACFPWNALQYVAQKEQSELIVAMSGGPVRMALAAKQTDIPILMLLQNVEFHLLGGDFRELGNVPAVANSRFTAEKYRTAFGINPRVIYPFISADRYRTERTKQNVTFINPIAMKGRDIALGIARQCPEIPFAFVESWQLFDENRHDLMQELQALPNITFLPPQNDMRAVYEKCGILLAPSVWEEAYGRVVTEAQISGIPVVASSRGGLPEAVGPGGILLDPEQPIADWTAAVRKLWHDGRHYDELSAAALAHAERREINSDHQIDAWESAMMTACRRTSASHTDHPFSASPRGDRIVDARVVTAPNSSERLRQDQRLRADVPQRPTIE
jgi:glycosyltransferase involved in cell wall biosynthesis